MTHDHKHFKNCYLRLFKICKVYVKVSEELLVARLINSIAIETKVFKLTYPMKRQCHFLHEF